MKKLLSLAFVATLSLSLFATDIFNYAPMSNNVRAYTETEFTIASKFGTYFRTPNSKITHSLDANGNEIESLELTPKDALINIIESSYDDKGNVTGQICKNADDEIIWKNTISYKDSLKSECSEYDAKNNLKAKIFYTYEAGKLVDETGYDADGILVWKTVYKYNVAEKLETESLYNSDGTLDERKIYAYTDADKLESITYIDSFYNKSTQEIFRYGSTGTLSEITTYDSAKEIVKRVVVKYDNMGNVSKVSEYLISNKFDTTVNELVSMKEYSYLYRL